MDVVLIEVPIMCRFARITMLSEQIPYETTIFAFRYLPKQNILSEEIFEAVNS